MIGPRVTVAIPVLDEEEHIGTCLTAVTSQTYAGLIEVLVIDGGSRDRTVEMAERFRGVRVLHNPRRRQAAGLNEALAQARGEIVVRVDAHAVVAPDYLTRCVDALEGKGAAMVGGAINPVARREGRGFQAVVAAAMSSPVGIGTARFHRPSARAGWTDTVYLGAYHTQTARSVGGYDPSAAPNEDAEFAQRMRGHGGIWFDPAIRSTYGPRTGPTALARQFFSYGRARARTVVRHPRSLSPRQVAAPVLLLGLLSPWRVLVAAAYAVVLAAAVLTARKAPVRVAAMVPVAVAIMHLSWGTGFLIGLPSAIVHRIVEGRPAQRGGHHDLVPPALAPPPMGESQAVLAAAPLISAEGPVVSLVIAYRKPDSLDRLLRGLSGPVWVANVGSDPAVAEVARRRGARAIDLSENRGFAAAVNAAMAEVEAEVVVLLNDDVVISDEAVAQLSDAVRRGADVAGPQVRNAAGELEPPLIGLPRPVQLAASLLLPDRPVAALAWMRVGKWVRPVEQTRVSALSAAALAVRAALLRECPLPEDYFMYWEEVEWFWTLHRRDARVEFLPQVEVVHHGGRTEVRPDKADLLARNAVLCARRTQGRWAAAAVWPIVIVASLRLLLIDGMRRCRGQVDTGRLAARWAGVRSAATAVFYLR